MNTMLFKKITSIIGLTTLSSSLIISDFAVSADFYDQATVIASSPIYSDVVQPRQECWTEYVTENVPVNNYPNGSYQTQNDRSPAGAIVGGIAGAIIGNQIGRGSGRAAATGVGAVVGGMIGDSISKNNSQPTYNNYPSYNGGYTTQQRPVQRCRTINDSQRVMQGYNVTYMYNGRQITERMTYDPGIGRTIPIRVGINRTQY